MGYTTTATVCVCRSSKGCNMLARGRLPASLSQPSIHPSIQTHCEAHTEITDVAAVCLLFYLISIQKKHFRQQEQQFPETAHLDRLVSSGLEAVVSFKFKCTLESVRRMKKGSKMVWSCCDSDQPDFSLTPARSELCLKSPFVPPDRLNLWMSHKSQRWERRSRRGWVELFVRKTIHLFIQLLPLAVAPLAMMMIKQFLPTHHIKKNVKGMKIKRQTFFFFNSETNMHLKLRKMWLSNMSFVFTCRGSYCVG